MNKFQEQVNMKLTEAKNKEDLQEAFSEIDDYVYVEDKERKTKLFSSALSWGASLALHIMIIFIAINIVYITMNNEPIEQPPVRVTCIPPAPERVKIEVDRKRDLETKDVIIEMEKESNDKGVLTQLELPEDIQDSSEGENTNDIQKGREEAKTDMEMGGNGMMAFMGVGGGSAGMYGNRNGDGKRRAKAKMGPFGKPSEAAQDAGLRWLKRHQSPDGSWSTEKYYLNCTLEQKCEPGKRTGGEPDVAMTGYACLSFLGAGYDHVTPNKFKDVVKKGIDQLLSIQKPDGLLGERNYEHAVATMALVEAYGMSNDPALRIPAQKAVDIIISRQAMDKDGDPYGGLLWNYTNPTSTRNDLSVTGWNIMSLKSAVASGFNVKNSIEGAKKSIDRVWKASNPNWEKLIDPYKDKSVFPYTWNATNNVVDKEHLSFVGSTCAIFLGHKSGDIMLETLMNDADERWIKSEKYKHNAYALYYLGMSFFQAGGDRWKEYLNTAIPYSIDQQRKSNDCFDGSWDSNDQSWPGADTGRVLITCYNILNLEVAYRYIQVHPEDKELIKKK